MSTDDKTLAAAIAIAVVIFNAILAISKAFLTTTTKTIMKSDNEQQILNSPLRPEHSIKPLKPHTKRHLLSGALVFLAGILVNEGISYYHRNGRTMTVRWSDGELQTNFRRHSKVPTHVPIRFEIGVADDGRVVWRAGK